MDRSRRALLAAFGTALSASVAGCPETSGDAATAEPTPDPSQPAETPTAEPDPATRANTTTRTGTSTPAPVTLAPGESYVTADGWDLTVENLAVRRAVVEYGPTHWDPDWADGGQFVVADLVVAGDGAPDPADPTDLRVACQTDTTDGTGRTFVVADSNADDIRQRLGFTVPASPAPAEGAIVWSPADGPEVRWALPDPLLAEIARLPEFDLRGFEVENVPGDEIAVTLTVANVGVGDGTFLAEVGHAAMSDQPELTVEVPAGETRTVTRRVPFQNVWNDSDDEPATVVLRYREKRLERTVEPPKTDG
ncbi:hypothetical protein ACFQMA_14665 [Halosimplex aquaticum]|uniref:CARDB protein n=1 Tax=Halosimplex aquaticum TaxID=3026162 RepID=A0ABD5Y5Q5_9EURY|nr:hypothetical protein [Halosimplex aquaticum]